jgi:hypothetical protein
LLACVQPLSRPLMMCGLCHVVTTPPNRHTVCNLTLLLFFGCKYSPRLATPLGQTARSSLELFMLCLCAPRALQAPAPAQLRLENDAQLRECRINDIIL